MDPLDLEECVEVAIVLEEDLIEFARHVRKHVEASEEPGKVLSRERERFDREE